MFMQMVFSKVHPPCHNVANGIKPGSTLNRLISMLPMAQNCLLGRKVIYVICINCSYNNVAGDKVKIKKLYLTSII